jgi:hypothetical protein
MAAWRGCFGQIQWFSRGRGMAARGRTPPIRGEGWKVWNRRLDAVIRAIGECSELPEAGILYNKSLNSRRGGRSSCCEMEQHPATLAVDRISLMLGKPARVTLVVHSAWAE